MPRYAITEKAGPFVAAHRNTGVGTILQISERQAEHEVRLGTLIELDKAPVPAVPEEPSGERKLKPKKPAADGDE